MPTVNPIETDVTNRKAVIKIDRELLIRSLGLPRSTTFHEAQWKDETLELVIAHKDINELPSEVASDHQNLPIITFIAENSRPRFQYWEQ